MTVYKSSLTSVRVAGRAIAAVCVAFALVACSSKPERPKPAELAPGAALIGVRQAWTARVGEVTFPLQAQASGSTLAVAGGDGTVLRGVTSGAPTLVHPFRPGWALTAKSLLW